MDVCQNKYGCKKQILEILRPYTQKRLKPFIWEFHGGIILITMSSVMLNWYQNNLLFLLEVLFTPIPLLLDVFINKKRSKLWNLDDHKVNKNVVLDVNLILILKSVSYIKHFRKAFIDVSKSNGNSNALLYNVICPKRDTVNIFNICTCILSTSTKSDFLWVFLI